MLGVVLVCPGLGPTSRPKIRGDAPDDNHQTLHTVIVCNQHISTCCPMTPSLWHLCDRAVTCSYRFSRIPRVSAEPYHPIIGWSWNSSREAAYEVIYHWSLLTDRVIIPTQAASRNRELANASNADNHPHDLVLLWAKAKHWQVLPVRKFSWLDVRREMCTCTSGHECSFHQKRNEEEEKTNEAK